MSEPTQAKYCPQCRVMNYKAAERCTHCGHEFRTGMPTPAPPEANFNRTQMFVMPPAAQQRRPRDTPIPRAGSGAWFIRSALSFFRVLFTSPRLLLIGFLLLLIVALVWWGAATFL